MVSTSASLNRPSNLDLREHSVPRVRRRRRRRSTVVMTWVGIALSLVGGLFLLTVDGLESVGYLSVGLAPFYIANLALYRAGLERLADLMLGIVGWVGITWSAFLLGLDSHIHLYFVVMVANGILVSGESDDPLLRRVFLVTPLALLVLVLFLCPYGTALDVDPEHVRSIGVVNDAAAVGCLVFFLLFFRGQTQRAEVAFESALDGLKAEAERRERAEDLLEQRHAFVSTVLSSIEAAVLTFDEDGQLTSANPAAAHMFGRPMRAGEGIRLEALFDGSRPLSGLSGTEQVLGRRDDGRTFPAEMKQSASVIDGEPVFTVVLRDLEQEQASAKALAAANRDKTALARQAGMAEVATSVLHNVGNVLSSVETSTYMVEQVVRGARLEDVERVLGLISAQDDLVAFFGPGGRGPKALAFLESLLTGFSSRRDEMEHELSGLRQHLDHIKAIIARQQVLAKGRTMVEPIDPEEIARDLRAHFDMSLKRHGVTLSITVVSDRPTFTSDRNVLLQIGVNLVENAKDALRGLDPQRQHIRVAIEVAGDAMTLAVTDQGVGMSEETLGKLFQHGFTTKPDGHGFGLHGSALQAQGLGGTIVAKSDGQGQGATFTLRIPLSVE